MVYMCVSVCVSLYVYIYKMEYYSNKKRMKSCHFTTWMDLKSIMLSEISQMERQIPYDFTHMWNLKREMNKKTPKQTHRYREQISDYQRGRGWGVGRMVKGV